jgi:hypothetical protein
MQPPLKFTGCIDEKDIFIIRNVAGGMYFGFKIKVRKTLPKHFINPIFPHSVAMTSGLTLPTNCVNMFLLILLLALMPFRTSLNKS